MAAAAVLLGWLYVSMKPGETPAPPASASPPATPGPSAPASAQEFRFELAGGRVISAPEALRVKRGSAVIIRVSSDKADELHLHGYDLELVLKAGQPGVLLFTAKEAGRFDLELHHAGVELGALEVQP